jgi:hypothetical protein
MHAVQPTAVFMLRVHIPVSCPGAEEEQQACVIAAHCEAAAHATDHALDDVLTAINPLHRMRVSPRRVLSTVGLHHSHTPAEAQSIHESPMNTASFHHMLKGCVAKVRLIFIHKEAGYVSACLTDSTTVRILSLTF